MSSEPGGTLLVIHLASTFGGAERTTLNILSGLNREGFSHVIVLAPQPMHIHWQGAADSVIDSGPLGLAGWFVSPARLRADARQLCRVIQAIRPDVVLGMMHYMAVAAEVAVRWAGSNARVVGSLRGPVFEHLLAYEPSWVRRLWIGWQLRRSGRGLFSITVPGAGTRAELLRHRVARPDQVTVIHNGIDPADFSIRAGRALDLPEGVRAGRFILALGRLSIEKRMSDLIAGYLQSKVNWPLVVVGDGPELEALRDQALHAGAGGRVHFPGATPFPERWMKRAGIFIHGCQYEGFGYTLLEALALAVPVIAQDCPFGPHEVLGDAGILVPRGNVGSLATAIRNLAMSERLRQELADAGPARARHFPLVASQRAHAQLLLAALRAERAALDKGLLQGGKDAHRV